MHHLSEKQYTNSNYGTVVPWFDYLFGTVSRLSDEELAGRPIGLEYLNRPRDTRIDRVLLLPLIWRRSVPDNDAIQDQPPALYKDQPPALHRDQSAAPHNSRST